LEATNTRSYSLSIVRPGEQKNALWVGVSSFHWSVQKGERLLTN